MEAGKQQREQETQISQGQQGAMPTGEATSAGGPPPARRRRGRIAVVVVSTSLLGFGALAAGIAVAAAASRTDGQNRIARGVSVAGIDLSELTPEQAREKLRPWTREQSAKPVTLVAPQSGRTWNIPLYEAGGRFAVDEAVEKAFAVGKDDNFFEQVLKANRPRDVDITPAFLLNEKALEKRLEPVAKAVRVAPQNARARMDASGVLVLSKPERKGVKLDVAATKAALLKSGVDALRDGEKVALVVQEETPKVTAAMLGQVGTLLGSYSTSYGSSSASRRHNVEKAAGFINGTLLGPGEVFSYNDTVGPRTPRLGWLNAPTYQDGQVVPGPGGGICQVSTTLYNAALRANLKIVERRNHSMPVHYAPAGCDATVNWGSIDFRFANSTEGPVYVLARASGGKLSFNLYGVDSAAPGNVDVVTGGRRGTRNGFAVSTWRVVTNADGTTTRESLGTSSYRFLNHSAAAPRPRRRVRRAASPVATGGAATRAPKPAAPAPPPTSAV